MKADTHVWTAHNGPSNETPQRRLPSPRHSGGWAAAEDEGRIRWALAEARTLLARCSGVREVLQRTQQLDSPLP